MAEAPTTSQQNQYLTWWLPLLIICLLGAFLRLYAIDRDLPVNIDPDEPTYYIWALSLQETGRVVSFYDVDQSRGTGYPPGMLYTMIIFQNIFEILSDDPAGTPTFMTTYFHAGRIFVAIVGIALAITTAFLGRMISKSQWVGLLAALTIAIWDVTVFQSRRFTSNIPWMFFTTLVFPPLFHAHNTKQFRWLYLALTFSLLSTLFQYQTALITLFPFIFAIIYFRHSQPRLLWHLGIWSGISILIALWLIFDYGILVLLNVDVLGFFNDSGAPVGLQSFDKNWQLVHNLVDSWWYILGALFTISFAIYATAKQKFSDLTNIPAIFTFATFIFLFYITMSFFAFPYVEKWLPLLPIIHILAFTAIIIIARLTGPWLAKFTKLEAHQITSGLQLITFTSIVILLARTYAPGWRWTYENQWQPTNTIVYLNRWIDANIPQGARVVEEAIKLAYNYPYAPETIHSYARESIFDESIESYRQRGYEYLIWNSMKSTPTDQLTDLETEEHQTYLQNAEEVLRITGEGFTGPDIVVYQLDPLPQNETYAWLGDIISFRGYDLAKATLAPGDELALTLYWMSIYPTETDLMVFIHIWDAANQQMIAQQDGPPNNGLDPTWQWLGDMQFHPDTHTIPIPPNAPPGEYQIRIGMYDIATGQRLPITPVGGEPLPESHLTLQTITITN